MKRFYLFFIAAIAVAGCSREPETTVTTATVKAEGQPEQTVTIETKNPAPQTSILPAQDKYTQAMYSQIKAGMTQEEVEKILGGPGEVVQSAEIGGVTSSNVAWRNSPSSFIWLGFANGKVVTLTATGLK